MPAGSREPRDLARLLARSWEVGLGVGAVTVVLGLVVALHPTTSLDVIAAFLGILLIVSGVFHMARGLDTGEAHRSWTVVVGILFVVVGVILLRHLDLTLALIAFLIGLIWMVQGMTLLVAGFADAALPARAWVVLFGGVSLVAGIVVISVPVASLVALAVLLGVWFIVLGCLQVAVALVLRAALHRAP